MKILITGATGLIGQALCQQLAAARHELVGLSRSARPSNDLPIRYFPWQPLTETPPRAALEGVEAVIHLAGENVAGRWTAERKRQIRDSRVLGTRNLIAGLRQISSAPRVLISGSAVGVYGDRGDVTLTEQASPGHGFLVDVCREWEAEARAAEALGTRVSLLRTGVVLSPSGGALQTMLPAFQFGVAGKLSNGQQWFPWIHLADIVGLILHALDTAEVRGPLNGVAPNPVTNEEFTKELAAVLNRPALFTVPKFALDLLFGEMAAVMLASQRVIPEAALQTGYRFQFPWLRSALKDLLGRG